MNKLVSSAALILIGGLIGGGGVVGYQMFKGVTKAEERAQVIVQESETRALAIVKAAEAKASSLVEEAEAKSRLTTLEAEAKAGELIAKAETDAKIAIADADKARNEADIAAAEAREDAAAKTRADARREADAIIGEANKKAVEITSTAQGKANELIAKAQAQADALLAAARQGDNDAVDDVKEQSSENNAQDGDASQNENQGSEKNTDTSQSSTDSAANTDDAENKTEDTADKGGEDGAKSTEDNQAQPATFDAASVFNFGYCPPGKLRGPKEPTGYDGRQIYAPNIAFPIAFDPSKEGVTLNSQLYAPGGYMYWKKYNRWDSHQNPKNFEFPWFDTFCEQAGGRTRYTTRLCSKRNGHQGVDIRPPSVFKGDKSKQGKADYWKAVSLFDGTFIYAKGSVVKIKNKGGAVTAIYRHLNPKSVRDFRSRKGSNRSVRKGEELGLVSAYNNSGTKKYTTPHLHLELKGQVNGRQVYLPSYASLVAAYMRRVGLEPPIDQQGFLKFADGLEQNNCPQSF